MLTIQSAKIHHQTKGLLCLASLYDSTLADNSCMVDCFVKIFCLAQKLEHSLQLPCKDEFVALLALFEVKSCDTLLAHQDILLLK